MDGCVLKSWFDFRFRLYRRPDSRPTRNHLPQRSIHRDAHEGDDRRTKLRDFLFEDAPALDVLRWFERIDPGTWTCDEIRHTDSPLRQANVIFVSHRLRDDAGLVKQAPEAIRRSGKVMPGQRRRHARVDADQEHAHAGLDPVGEPQVLILRLPALGFRP